MRPTSSCSNRESRRCASCRWPSACALANELHWFFDDRESLLAALLERLADQEHGNLIRQAESYAETLPEAVLNVFDCWFDDRLFDSRLEFAVRSWAQQSGRVAGEVIVADADRLRALTSMFVRFRCDRLEADVRARTVYLTQLGYISQKAYEEQPVRMRRISASTSRFSRSCRRSRASSIDSFARQG